MDGTTPGNGHMRHSHCLLLLHTIADHNVAPKKTPAETFLASLGTPTWTSSTSTSSGSVCLLLQEQTPGGWIIGLLEGSGVILGSDSGPTQKRTWIKIHQSFLWGGQKGPLFPKWKSSSFSCWDFGFAKRNCEDYIRIPLVGGFNPFEKY